jgi:hypothetical protein
MLESPQLILIFCKVLVPIPPLQRTNMALKKGGTYILALYHLGLLDSSILQPETYFKEDL